MEYWVLSNPPPQPSFPLRILNFPGNQLPAEGPKLWAASLPGGSKVSEGIMVVVTATSKAYSPSPQNKALSPYPEVDKSLPVYY